MPILLISMVIPSMFSFAFKWSYFRTGSLQELPPPCGIIHHRLVGCLFLFLDRKYRILSNLHSCILRSICIL